MPLEGVFVDVLESRDVGMTDARSEEWRLPSSTRGAMARLPTGVSEDWPWNQFAREGGAEMVATFLREVREELDSEFQTTNTLSAKGFPREPEVLAGLHVTANGFNEQSLRNSVRLLMSSPRIRT